MWEKICLSTWTGSILTAITIMLLVGAFAVSHSIYECFTPYFDETRVEDASFVTMTEIPEEEREVLEKAYDVTLERQQYTDLDYDGTRLAAFCRDGEAGSVHGVGGTKNRGGG